MTSNKNKYYIYQHYNNNGIIFYVGISSVITKKGEYIGFKRAKEKHLLHNNWMNYIKENNINWNDNINALKQNCKIIDDLTFNQAKNLEKMLIEKYGRKDIDENGLLINKRKGGGGSIKNNKNIPKLIISNSELNFCKLYQKKLKNDISKIKQIISKYKWSYSIKGKLYQKEYRKNHIEYFRNYHKKKALCILWKHFHTIQKRKEWKELPLLNNLRIMKNEYIKKLLILL